MKAPTIPTMRSPTIPSPVPCTIWPASHPAMRPTPNMIRRLSFDRCIFVFQTEVSRSSVLLVNSPGYSNHGRLNFNTLVVERKGGNRPKPSRLEAAAVECGGEAVDRVRSRRRGRRAVGCPTGTPGRPCLYLRMLVGRGVVDDGVDRHSHRQLRLGSVEEADERL